VQTTFNTSIGPALEFLYGKQANVRLGFGCASLMRLPSRRRRQALLGEAFEQGIRHFDVARMYGLGAAEGELGRFAKGRREEIAIATKFGIAPSGKIGRLAPLQAPARALLARFPALRARVKRNEGALHTPRHYDAASACASLETSLRELGTDYVDVLFVHDPGAVALPDMDELVGVLEGLREAGRIRAWGVSGEPGPALLLATGWPQCVPQLRNDIFSFDAPQTSGKVPPIYFGVFAEAMGRIRGRLLADEKLRVSWQRGTGLDCADSKVLARLLLQDALERNHAGGAIFATTRPQRIGEAVCAAAALRGAAAPAPLKEFRRLVAAVDWEAADA
jgi:D-threo-aldose 1-dehydrogenase